MFNTGNLGAQSLEVEVRDEDVLGADDVIGVVGEVPLAALREEPTRRVTLELQRPRKRQGARAGLVGAMMKMFGGCCRAAGGGDGESKAAGEARGGLGTVTLELDFVALNF